MASFSTWRPLENRVLKTWFISPYITKQQLSKKRNQSHKEKKKKDWTEKKSNHPGRASPAAWAAQAPGRASLGHASPKPREPGSREPQAARAWAGSRKLFLSLSNLVDLTLSLSLIWSPSLWSDSLSLWSDPIRWGEAVQTWSFFKFFWIVNRVLKTRFSSGRHVENDATSDMIRPWKSSLKESIYMPKIESLKLELLIKYIVSKPVY